MNSHIAFEIVTDNPRVSGSKDKWHTNQLGSVVVSSIPGKNTCLSCRFNLPPCACRRQAIDVALYNSNRKDEWHEGFCKDRYRIFLLLELVQYYYCCYCCTYCYIKNHWGERSPKRKRWYVRHLKVSNSYKWISHLKEEVSRIFRRILSLRASSWKFCETFFGSLSVSASK